MIIVLLVVGAGCSRGPVGDANRVIFPASDRIDLYGTLLTPDPPARRGLILLHMLGSDRSAWDAFASRASSEGYAVLAFDMRGHGETGAGQAMSHRTMDRDSWLRAERDLAAAKAVLQEQGVDPSEIAIAGASIGANLALRYAATDSDIAAVILLSPGKSYRDVEILPALQGYGRRPILVLSSEGDSYATETARALKAQSVDHCELRVFEGSAHGTDLLAAYPEAMGQILLWLDPILPLEQGVTN